MKLSNYHVETPYTILGIEDGILYSIYKPGLMLSLDIAKKYIVQERLKISNGVVMPFLADIRGLKHVDDDARDYLASEEAGAYLNALAIVTNNPIQNLFANFYLKLSKPPMPTQLFTDKSKALRWLQLYKQAH